MTTEEINKIIAEANTMSDDAFYIMTQGYFGQWIDGGDHNAKSALMVVNNDRQRKAYEELLNHGMVWLDTERQYIGYRSSEKGRIVYEVYRQQKD